MKFKSLAAEARLIRLEERRAKAKRQADLRSSLYHHRIDVVRPAARSTHLAATFLRGTPYKAAEKEPRTAPDWKAIEKMILKYGEGDQRDLKQRFAEWKA